MKKLFLWLIISLSYLSIYSQTAIFVKWPNGYAPQIDGIEDGIWPFVDFKEITHKFGAELPTLYPCTSFRAAWNDTAIFVIVYVNDDHYCDRWCSGIDSLSDRVELYFDVNDTLHDGIGAKTMYDGNGTGHYRFAPVPDSSFKAGITQGVHFNIKTGKWVYHYAYVVTDSNYIFEYAIRINSDGGLTKKDGTIWMSADSILFECTINDCDPGDTTQRRMNWHTPEGSNVSAWDNMDVAGKVWMEITEWPEYGSSPYYCNANNINLNHFNNFLIFPNPAFNRITIFGTTEINRITILDMLGRTLKTLPNNKAESMEINVSDLSTGVYLIKISDIKGNILTKRFLKK